MTSRFTVVSITDLCRASDTAQDIAIQADGKIVVVGDTSPIRHLPSQLG